MELKIARRIARLTQKQLADLAGVDDSTISQIETGQRDIRGMSYEKVVRLAHALGVRPEELWPVEIVLPAAHADEVRDDG